MRRLLRNRWLMVLVIWTAFVAVPAVQLWPAANTPAPPCNYQGSGVQDPALPPCPPDGANYDAIGLSLLVVLWLAGVTVGISGLGISRLVGKRWERDALPSDSPAADDEPLNA